MVISSVREAHPHGAQHTAHGKLHRIITAANKNVPEATHCSRRNRHILTVDTVKHQGAWHSGSARQRSMCGRWHALRPSQRFSFVDAAADAAGNEDVIYRRPLTQITLHPQATGTLCPHSRETKEEPTEEYSFAAMPSPLRVMLCVRVRGFGLAGLDRFHPCPPQGPRRAPQKWPARKTTRGTLQKSW